MKKLLLFALLVAGCKQSPPQEKAIMAFMRENAHDPSAYEPISFEFIGPATNDNTGVLPGDSARIGDLYRHTFRGKNGFGATMLHSTVFYYSPVLEQAANVEDSVAEAHGLLP